MARKTVDIIRMRTLANTALAGPLSEQGKEAVFTFAEILLHETGNYKGFRYVDGWQGTETYRRAFY